MNNIDLSFNQVCKFIKNDQQGNQDIIDAVDKLLGFTLICSSLFDSTTISHLPSLAVKNEFIKLTKSIFNAFTAKKGDDYITKQERMQVAYGLICFTAFFDALDRQIPAKLRAKIDMRKEEKDLSGK